MSIVKRPKAYVSRQGNIKTTAACIPGAENGSTQNDVCDVTIRIFFPTAASSKGYYFIACLSLEARRTRSQSSPGPTSPMLAGTLTGVWDRWATLACQLWSRAWLQW